MSAYDTEPAFNPEPLDEDCAWNQGAPSEGPEDPDAFGQCETCFCCRWLATITRYDDKGNAYGTCRGCARGDGFMIPQQPATNGRE
jgi:hypothetical protein